MTVYRLHCFDGRGKIGQVETLEADDDEDAVRKASALKLDVSCEVWDGARLVSHLKAAQESEPL